MNEVAWFIAAWAGGLAGGVSIGWTAAAWSIRTRAHRAARRIVAQCAEAWLCRDVTRKETLDAAPDVIRVGRSDLPAAFWQQKKESN